MDRNDFNTNYLNNLPDKVSKEQKSVFLLGDFDVNLLNHNSTNEFLDSSIYIVAPIYFTNNSANFAL